MSPQSTVKHVFRDNLISVRKCPCMTGVFITDSSTWERWNIVLEKHPLIRECPLIKLFLEDIFTELFYCADWLFFGSRHLLYWEDFQYCYQLVTVEIRCMGHYLCCSWWLFLPWAQALRVSSWNVDIIGATFINLFKPMKDQSKFQWCYVFIYCICLIYILYMSLFTFVIICYSLSDGCWYTRW